MEVTVLAAQARKEQKKGPARRLRQSGFVPGILYGRAVDNILLAVKNDELIKLHKDKKDHAFIKLIIDDGGKKTERLSLIKELQIEPLTGRFFHADFYEIDMKRKLTFDVTLSFTGKAVGVENGGELQHIKRHVTVSCLPADLPDHIEVDVSALDIGDSVKVKELKVPDTIAVLDAPDAAVASVAVIKVVKAAVVEEEAAVATEEGAAAEGKEAPEKEKEKEK